MAKKALVSVGEKNIKILIEEFNKIKDEEIKIKIIEILGEIRNEGSIEVLLKSLKERNPFIRMQRFVPFGKSVKEKRLLRKQEDF